MANYTYVPYPIISSVNGQPVTYMDNVGFPETNDFGYLDGYTSFSTWTGFIQSIDAHLRDLNSRAEGSSTPDPTGEVDPPAPTGTYWYIGIVSPSDPTSAAENTGNNKWTQLTSKPDSITIYAGPQMPPEVWYIAIPHSYGFQAYDSTGAAPDTAAYTKSQITIAGTQYDLFTGAGRAPAVNAVFKP